MVDSGDKQAWQRKWGWIGIGIIGFIVVETCIYTGAVGPRPWWSAACGGLLACAAPFAVGALVGFLFGIPRTLQVDARQDAPNANNGAPSYRVNTNLEQISDWLTKILVGVGLTQFKEIPPLIASMAARTATIFGSTPTTTSTGVGIAATVLVTFLIAGFFVGYLATRLILAPAFKKIESPDPDTVKRLNTVAADFGKGDAKNIAGASSDDVQQMLRYRLEDLSNPADVAAWAKAQMAKKNYADAVAGYSKALSLSPNDPQLLQQHAAALAASRNFDRAHSELEKAADLVDTPQDRQRVAEGLVLTSLYDDPPEGFQNAIKYGENYIADPKMRPSAAIEAWLGAAYGQKYRWLSEQKPPASKDDLDAARAAALEHVKKALQLDAGWKRVLAGLLTQSQDGGDDDLEAFRDDPEFRKLLL